MSSQSDNRDQRQALTIAVAITVLVLVGALALWLMLPLVSEFAATHLSPGLGLKDAAVIAFFVTIVVMIVLAVAAGDGLIGEIQFMLAGFLSFFLILWLMIAWIF